MADKPCPHFKLSFLKLKEKLLLKVVDCAIGKQQMAIQQHAITNENRLQKDKLEALKILL